MKRRLSRRFRMIAAVLAGVLPGAVAAADAAGEAGPLRNGAAHAAAFQRLDADRDWLATRDSLITARVKAALLGDPVVRAFVVSVETYKGTVLLSGFVHNREQARRAAEIAAGVEGVVAVRNALSVRT